MGYTGAASGVTPDASVAESAFISIKSDEDLIAARHHGRVLAERLGFGRSEATLVATAISELARNIVLYAGSGEIVLTRVEDGEQQGICIVARDDGPGIANTNIALEVGYSTSGGLGLGLPGVRRIMDEFEITSKADSGTVVRAVRWKRR